MDFSKSECKITGIIDESYGKFRENDIENILIMEYD